jgi:hypothetical protein
MLLSFFIISLYVCCLHHHPEILSPLLELQCHCEFEKH